MKKWKELIDNCEKIRPHILPQDQHLIDEQIKRLKKKNLICDLVDIGLKLFGYLTLFFGLYVVYELFNNFNVIDLFFAPFFIYHGHKISKGLGE